MKITDDGGLVSKVRKRNHRNIGEVMVQVVAVAVNGSRTKVHSALDVLLYRCPDGQVRLTRLVRVPAQLHLAEFVLGQVARFLHADLREPPNLHTGRLSDSSFSVL